jgi:hypothetical protein
VHFCAGYLLLDIDCIDLLNGFLHFVTVNIGAKQVCALAFKVYCRGMADATSRAGDADIFVLREN